MRNCGFPSLSAKHFKNPESARLPGQRCVEKPQGVTLWCYIELNQQHFRHFYGDAVMSFLSFHRRRFWSKLCVPDVINLQLRLVISAQPNTRRRALVWQRGFCRLGSQ